MEKVILYTTGCPKCIVIEKKLNMKGVAYDIVADEAVMERKGIATVPMLEINGRLLDFGEANQWVNGL